MSEVDAGDGGSERSAEPEVGQALEQEMRAYDRALIAVIVIAGMVAAVGWWWFNSQPSP